MSFWKTVLGWPDEPTEQPQEVVTASDLTDRDFNKCDAHIRRFSLAVEQCTKGPERKEELLRNLNFWKAVKKLREMR